MDRSQTLPVILRSARPLSRLTRAGLLAGLVLGGVLIWLSHAYLTNTFADNLKTRAELRSAFISGAIDTVLQSHRVIPAILARDRELIAALETESYATTSQRLIALQDEVGTGDIFLLDAAGRLVAGSNRHEIASAHAEATYFLAARRETGTVFSILGIEEEDIGFYFSRRVAANGETIGVIVVRIELQNVEANWLGSQDRVIVTNSQDVVLLASEPTWRYRLLAPFLDEATIPLSRYSQIAGIRVLPQEVSQGGRRVEIDGRAFLPVEQPLGFRGWTLTYLAQLDDVAARVNAVIALEIMALALLAALVFYIASRRAARQTQRFAAESVELRALNDRLAAEIEERRRVERSLEAAEQSLVQASKLAALGQMAAAISHELNQPLAAMRTYLAGARLLVQRKRPAEALSSFQRVDDLITRMGSITSQLKSFARKGERDRKSVV